MPNPESILIIKPGSLGDIVHALPAVGYLRNAWPGVHISWIVDSRWKGLLEHAEGIDRLVEFPRERFRGPGGWAKSVQWFRSLGKLEPDIAVDLQGLMRSGLMARASGAKVIAGGSDAREGAGFLYHIHSPVDTARHAVDRYRAILLHAGVPTSGTPSFALKDGKPLKPSVKPPFLLLHPFARGEGKSLDGAHVRAIASGLSPRKVVLVGQGEPVPDLPDNVVDLLNKTTLSELIWLARRADFVVSVDSGPVHIAAAVNPNLLSIHTWSDPRKVGPYHPESFVWQGGEIRRQNLAADAVLRPSKQFSAEDVACVVECVRSHPGIAGLGS